MPNTKVHTSVMPDRAGSNMDHDARYVRLSAFRTIFDSNLLPITLDRTNNRVGINNTVPTYTLDIVAGDGNGLRVDRNAAGEVHIELQNNDGSVFLVTDGGYLSLGPNSGATAGNFNIDSSGNVGVQKLSPNSVFDINGSISIVEADITATDTMDDTDFAWDVDTAAGAVVVNLPALSGIQGRIYSITKTTADANTVTITPNGVETINGAGTLVLNFQWSSALIQARTNGWRVI